MANYHGTARSSYFEVKDREAFREALAPFSVEIVGNSKIALVSKSEDGSWDLREVDENGDEQAFDLISDLPDYLKEGEVAIFMECGAEGHRYVVGEAIAISWDGGCCEVSLNDIYEKAEHLLNGEFTQAEY